jgi:hypothetical protein
MSGLLVAVGIERVVPALERTKDVAGFTDAEVRGDGLDAANNARVGLDEQLKPAVGESEVESPAVGRVRVPFDQAAGDEAVDDGRDARAAHRQTSGDSRRRRRTFGEETQDVELGHREVERRQRALDLLAQS